MSFSPYLTILGFTLLACSSSVSNPSGSNNTGTPGTQGTGTDGGAGGVNGTLTRFTAVDVVREEEWSGNETIVLKSAGVPVSVQGGVKVESDASFPRIRVLGRLLAMAPGSAKVDADATIQDVQSSFKVTKTGNVIAIECGHGQTHGESRGDQSGCELIELVFPGGKPVSLQIEGQNGDIDVKIPTSAITKLAVANKGGGKTTVTCAATKAGTIDVLSEKSGDIALTLPTDFAADEIVVEADQDKITSSATDAKLGAGAGGRGAVGSGLKSIRLVSKEFAGGTGSVQF